MPRLFNRIVTFKVEGEIYDRSTKAEDIIKNYDWKCHENPKDSNEFDVIGKHKDKRGRITKMTRLPKIHLYKKPDTEFFLA